MHHMVSTESYRGIAIVHHFFSGTGETYETVVNLFTLGFDAWWKKKILRQIPPDPSHILDQGCGTGILAFKIARHFPFCRVIGVELRWEYLFLAKEKAKALPIKNVEFILGRAEEVILRQKLDCITSSYLAKYADLKLLVRNAKTMLRPGGKLIVHDFIYPPGRKFARAWELYFKILQRAGTAVFPEWKRAFDELPEFLKGRPWVTELIESLERERFSKVCIEFLTLGSAVIVSATKS